MKYARMMEILLVRVEQLDETQLLVDYRKMGTV